MAKFDSGCLDHSGFNAIKVELTAALAAAIEQELKCLGDAIVGVSWFSSCAQIYDAALYARAA